jgi:predicted membrane-bound spermidine synthase
MFVEISQIQHLNIFLGHPTYSIAAALFTLLVSSGAGSYFSGANKDNTRGTIIRFILLLAVLLLFGIFTADIINAFREQSTPVRIVIASVMLFPIGFFMGMAFPVGMRLASQKSQEVTPWLWGINGVMSVLATVLSIIIAMNYGISASYWTGALCYLIAVLSFIFIIRKNRQGLIRI